MKNSTPVKILSVVLLVVIGWNYWLPTARNFFNEVSSTDSGELHNVDFFAYYNAGSRFLRDDNPYFWGRDGNGNPIISDFIYPPAVLPIFSLVAQMPYDQARLIWLIAYGLSFVGILAWMVFSFGGECRLIFLALGLEFSMVSFPLLSHILHGQIDVFIISLILACYLFYAGKKRLPAAILLAVATLVKISPGFMLIYFVIFRRDLRFLLMYIGILAALMVFSLAYTPHGWYIDYVRYVLPEIGKGDNFWLNQSLLKYFSAYPTLARIVEIGGLGLLGLLAWFIGRRYSPEERQPALPLGKDRVIGELVFILNLSGTLIFLGRAWVAAYVWLILPSAWLATILLTHRTKPILLVGVAVGILLVLAKVYGFPILDSLNMWGGLLLTISLAAGLLTKTFLPLHLPDPEGDPEKNDAPQPLH